MADEISKDSKALPPLNDVSLIEALKHFGIAFGSDLMNASNQMNCVMPIAGSMFSILSNQPMQLGMNMDAAQSNAVRLQNGVMAMYLRREAHAKYLRDGNEAHVLDVERDIDLMSPYSANSKIGMSDLMMYLAFILPFSGGFWQIKYLSPDLQNTNVFNLGILQLPAEGEALRYEDSDGTVEVRQTTSGYSLSFLLPRELPPTHRYDLNASRSSTLVTFSFSCEGEMPRIKSIGSGNGVLVHNALERTSYTGGDGHVDVDRFRRLFASFLKTGNFCTWDQSQIDGADQWLLSHTAPPMHLVLESAHERLPESWEEGDTYPSLLEDNKTAQKVFLYPGARPLGEGVPLLTMEGYPHPHLGVGRDGLSDDGTAPILAVTQHDGHRLAYAEWNNVRLPTEKDAADATTILETQFLLVVDKCLMITGSVPRQSYLKDYWRWIVKGLKDQSDWKPFSISPPTYTALTDYLKVARDGYTDRLNMSALRPFIEANAPSATWCPRDGERSQLLEQLHEQGFSRFIDELSSNGYSRQFRKIFAMDAD